MIGTTAVAIIKAASAFAVASGVSTMVGYAAKSSVPKVAPLIIRSRPGLSAAFHVFQKVAIPAGAAALAGMASEQAVKYTERRIDEDVATVNGWEAKAKAAVNKAKADGKEDESTIKTD